MVARIYNKPNTVQAQHRVHSILYISFQNNVLPLTPADNFAKYKMKHTPSTVYSPIFGYLDRRSTVLSYRVNGDW
jgi:hypothetical protein